MPVRYEREGPLAAVTIDRPDAGNAFTEDTAEALREMVSEAMEADDVGALVLEGAGRAFCTGADLEAFERALEGGEQVEVVSRLSGAMNDVIAAIVRGSIPVVACVNGPAAGGGLGLALACDLRVAAASATLTPGFVSLGVSPDGGTTWFLPRIVGDARAREILLEDETLDAEAALDEGLVTEVVPDDEVRKRTRERARSLAEKPRTAIASAKARLSTPQDDLVEHLDAERETTALSAESEAFREGVERFLDGG